MATRPHQVKCQTERTKRERETVVSWKKKKKKKWDSHWPLNTIFAAGEERMHQAGQSAPSKAEAGQSRAIRREGRGGIQEADRRIQP